MYCRTKVETYKEDKKFSYGNLRPQKFIFCVLIVKIIFFKKLEGCVFFKMEAKDNRLEPKVSKKRQREPLSVEEYNVKTWKRLLKKSTESTEPPPPGLEKPCRLFHGYIDNSGYGQVGYQNKLVGAHRASLMVSLNTDSLPKTNDKGEKLQVRHLCNNSKCIEPMHLLLGTISENGEDRVKNGLSKGENHFHATITNEVASNIKLSLFPKGHKNYKPHKEIAKMFGTSHKIVSTIKTGEAWGWLPFADGSTSETKAKSKKTQHQKMRKLAKEKTWTPADWEKAKAKLNNLKYVKKSETRSFNGIFCKNWIRAKDINGYGVTSINNVQFQTHILACTISNNFIRPKNLNVRHLCGNSSCVEGAHLKFGTQEENMLDKISHGTTNTKVSQDMVEEIRMLYAKGGLTYKEVGEKYGICFTTVGRIIRKQYRDFN
jgi:hypothetical protein